MITWLAHGGWLAFCGWLVWRADVVLGLLGLMWYCFGRAYNGWLNLHAPTSAAPEDTETRR